jgi:hypothetical protein
VVVAVGVAVAVAVGDAVAVSVTVAVGVSVRVAVRVGEDVVVGCCVGFADAVGALDEELSSQPVRTRTGARIRLRRTTRWRTHRRCG